MLVRLQHWQTGLAGRQCHGAAASKGATRRQIDRAGDLTLQDLTFAALPDIRRQLGREQGTCIGVGRRLEDLFCWSAFDHGSQLQDHNAFGDQSNRTEVMRDEQERYLALFAQANEQL